MADGFVQVGPDSTGKLIDNTELTVGANTVERQRVNIADSVSATQIATVTPGNALKVDGSATTQPVSGTFWPATQPVSGTVSTTPPANASENLSQVGGTGITLGQKVAASSIPVVLDSDTDRGQKTMANSLPVAIASDQSGLPVTANGDIDHDAVNTLKNIQIAGNASPVKTTPAAISATGDRVRAWLDQDGRVIHAARKLPTYVAVYRLAVTNAEADLTFTHVANTDKQYATIYHAATAVKLVKIKRIELWLDNVATAAGIFFVELRRLSATTAPATGNPAITPLAYNTVDGAAETTCLALPTTAGSEAAANSPIASLRLDLGLTTAAPTTNPIGLNVPIVLWEEPDWMAESDFLSMRNGVAEGYAIIVRSSAASVTRAKARIVFTEEIP